LLRLRISGRQRHPVGQLPVEADLKGVLARAGQGDVEDQDGPGFDVNHPGGWLAELNRSLASQQLVATLIHEADPDGVHPDLGAAAPYPEDQMGSGIYRWKVGEPDMLKHAQDTELSLLVDQCVIGDDGEIEMQLS
jgi:hypothetical protein